MTGNEGRTTIDGAVINQNIVTILKDWQTNDNVPELHVEKLCNLQDFFCRLLINKSTDVGDEIITEFLQDIIVLKDDLKMFDIENRE